MVEKLHTGNIKLEDVRKTFPSTHPGESTVIALEKINAAIEPGEVYHVDWSFRMWKIDFFKIGCWFNRTR